MNIIELIDKCREKDVGVLTHVKADIVEITLIKNPFEISKMITSQELHAAKSPDKYVESVVDELLGGFDTYINKVKEEIAK